jgi:hypothetical protein
MTRAEVILQAIRVQADALLRQTEGTSSETAALALYDAITDALSDYEHMVACAEERVAIERPRFDPAFVHPDAPAQAAGWW